MFRGIDVSTWQGSIDWNKVKGYGIEFAIIREGFGKKLASQVDKRFKENIAGAQNAGISAGVYHYSYAKNVQDAVSEAQFCLENIKGLKLEYPVCFDIEDKQMLTLSNEQRTQICDAFCKTIENEGYYAMIYCNLNWINNYLNAQELLKKYDLWLAQWAHEMPDLDCGIWQKSECGKIDGIEGHVDINISYKDYPSIMKAKGLNGFSCSTAKSDNSGENFFYYEVQKGDSLWALAKKYLGSGALYLELKTLNNLQTDTIYVGQTIKIRKKEGN